MRVVFDTNIYISALIFPGSTAASAVLKILDGKDTLLVSRAIIDELLGVLAVKFSHDREALCRVAVTIAEMADLIEPGERLEVLADEPDNRILECALAGKADVIVTGDKAMLSLQIYEGIRIITLREYIDLSNKS